MAIFGFLKEFPLDRIQTRLHYLEIHPEYHNIHINKYRSSSSRPSISSSAALVAF